MVLRQIIDFINAHSLVLLVFFVLVGVGLILFVALPPFRGLRIRVKIRLGRLRSKLGHYWYSLIGVVRLFSAMKMLILVLAGIGVLIFLVLLVIDAWNIYVATPHGLPELGLPFPLWRLLFVMGWILGALMSFFMKPKVKKFADKVNAKPNVFYVFGSNQLTEMLLNKLMALGMGVKTALIAGKKRLWVENLPGEINKLILDNPEELKTDTLYEIVTFSNASRVIVLVDNPDLAGHIITNVRKRNPDVELILLSNNKPAFLDLSAGKFENVQIIEDTEAILRELTGKLALGYDRPNVIALPSPREYVGRSPTLLEKDFKRHVKVLGIRRNGSIIETNQLQKGDHILLYIGKSEILGELLQLTGELTVREKESAKKEEPEEIEIEVEKLDKDHLEEGEMPKKEGEEEPKEATDREEEKEDRASEAFGKVMKKREEDR